jgi:hypothetical protein
MTDFHPTEPFAVTSVNGPVWASADRRVSRNERQLPAGKRKFELRHDRIAARRPAAGIEAATFFAAGS